MSVVADFWSIFFSRLSYLLNADPLLEFGLIRSFFKGSIPCKIKYTLVCSSVTFGFNRALVLCIAQGEY